VEHAHHRTHPQGFWLRTLSVRWFESQQNDLQDIPADGSQMRVASFSRQQSVISTSPILRNAVLQEETKESSPMRADMSPDARNQRQQAAIRTGMYVKARSGLRLRYRKVRRLVRKMHVAMPWLSEVDLPAARAWAELEILASNAFADLYMNGVTSKTGEPRRLLSELRQLRTAQLAYERDLGMTPAARMNLRVGDAKARALTASVEPADEAEVGALEARLLRRLDGGDAAVEDRDGADR
jgi:hypothetical protein